MPAERKPRLMSFSFSVMRLIKLGTMMKRVHQPSKKTLRLNKPRALPPKRMPRAIMAMPQMIGRSCFMFVNSFRAIITCLGYNDRKENTCGFSGRGSGGACASR